MFGGVSQERGLKLSFNNLGGASIDTTSLANRVVSVLFSFTPALLLSLAMGTSFVRFFQGTSVLTFSLTFLFLAENSLRKRFF